MKTQTDIDRQTIFDIIKSRGSISSIDLKKDPKGRTYTARISDLIKAGAPIRSERFDVGNSWATRYVFVGDARFQYEVKKKKSIKVQPKPIRWEFDMNTNTARPIYA